jgi:hypothetical protein
MGFQSGKSPDLGNFGIPNLVVALQKKEEQPKKLQAIKCKVEKIYRFCYALFTLRAKNYNL